MTRASFQDTQCQFASYLRQQKNAKPPTGIEERRLSVYRDLIYNNIKGFIDSSFPVLQSITSDSVWNETIRQFVSDFKAQSPYFSEVSKEFLQFLNQFDNPLKAEFNFTCELAHYEWVELALMIEPTDIAQVSVKPSIDLMHEQLVFSPLAWPLVYEFDVHHISPDYIPESSPSQPTFLVVYRNRQDDVQFMEINALTYRLIELLKDSPQLTGQKVLVALQESVPEVSAESIFKHGLDILLQLFKRDIILSVAN